MKSIIFGLSLISAAAAQVVNGVSMVPAQTASGSASASAVSSDSSAPSASGSSGSSGSSAPSASSAAPSNADNSNSGGGYSQYQAPPSQYTQPPSSSSADFYQQMPYSSYQNGGYKSLSCGYGYTKDSDGSCKPESWVICDCISSIGCALICHSHL